MQLGHAGLVMIESSEGWSSVPYWDSIGRVWTAYFGETDGITSRSPKKTRTQGEVGLIKRFAGDYAWALEPFTKLKGFTQNMYDALASFIWNCGTGAVSSSTRVGRLLRERQWAAAGTAMLAWCKGGGRVIPGLLSRRKRERTLLLTPVIASVKTTAAVLTNWERETVATLEAERRTKNRRGGWDHVDPSHLQNAAKAKQELRARVDLLSKADDKAKAHRQERITLLKKVIADQAA